MDNAQAPTGFFTEEDYERLFGGGQQGTPQAQPQSTLFTQEDYAALFGGAPTGTAPTKPTQPTQPQPPLPAQQGGFFSEFGKGVAGAWEGVKGIPGALGVQSAAAQVGRAKQAEEILNRIDRGEQVDLNTLNLPTPLAQPISQYARATSQEARQRARDEINTLLQEKQQDIGEYLQSAAARQKEAAKYAPAVAGVSDIRDVGQFRDWLGYQIGSGLVQIAPVMAAGLVAGPGGAFGVGTAMSLQEGVQSRLEFILDKVKALPPEQQAQAVQEYLAKTEDTTLAVALVAGALDSVSGPVGTVTGASLRKMLAKTAGKEVGEALLKETGEQAALNIIKSQVAKEVAEEVAGKIPESAMARIGKAALERIKDIPAEMTEEGITGGMQELGQILGEFHLGEQVGAIMDPKNIKRVVDAAAAEAVGSLGGSGVNIASATGRQSLIELTRKISTQTVGTQFDVATYQKEKIASDPRNGAAYADAVQKYRSEGKTEAEAQHLAGLDVQEGRIKLGISEPDTGRVEPSVPVPSGIAGTEQVAAQPEETGVPPVAVPSVPADTTGRGVRPVDGSLEGAQTPATPTPTPAPTPATPKLPQTLAKAAPTYNFGQKKFGLTFESDVDKAAYIIANKKSLSARDAAFLQFVADSTGLTEDEARALGQQVKAAIKEQARGAEPGTLTVPAMWKPAGTVQPQQTPQAPVVTEQAPIVTPQAPVVAEETPQAPVVAEEAPVTPEPITPKRERQAPPAWAQEALTTLDSTIPTEPQAKPWPTVAGPRTSAIATLMQMASNQNASDGEREIAQLLLRHPSIKPNEIETAKRQLGTRQWLQEEQKQAVRLSLSDTVDAGTAEPASIGKMSGLNRLALEITTKWETRPDVIVLSSMDDPRVPEAVKAEHKTQLENGATAKEVEGFYYNGDIYINGAVVNTPQDVARVVFHEGLGHYGLRGVFGKPLDAILDRVVQLRRDDVLAVAEKYGLSATDPEALRVAAEEVLAHIAQTRPQAGLVQRAIAAIRTWLRNAGLKNLKLSDTEIIRDYLIPARAFVEQGAEAGKAAVEDTGRPAFARKAASKQPQPTPTQPTKPKTKAPTAAEKIMRTIGRSEEAADAVGKGLKFRDAESGLRAFASMWDTLSTKATGLMAKAFTTNDLVRWAGKHVPGLVDIGRLVEAKGRMFMERINALAKTEQRLADFAKQFPKGIDALARLVNASTMAGVDASQYKDLADALARDPKAVELRDVVEKAKDNPSVKAQRRGRAAKKLLAEREQVIKLLFEGGQYTDPETGVRTAVEGWNALGKFGKGEGQELYKLMFESFRKMLDASQKMREETINKMDLAPEDKSRLMQYITQQYQEARKLGAYFPLMRFGQYWVRDNSVEGGLYTMFESSIDRDNYARQLAKRANKPYQTALSEGDVAIGNNLNVLRDEVAASSKMLKETFAALDSLVQSDPVSGQKYLADIEMLKDEVYQSYLMTLPEADMRRKFLHRKNKAGFSMDIQRVFASAQMAGINQLTRLAYMNDIRGAIGLAYREASRAPDPLKWKAIVDEVATRASNEIAPPAPKDDLSLDKLASIGNKVTFYYMLTSPRTAIAQMTQLPIMLLPALYSRFGTVETTKILAKYTLGMYDKLGVTRRNDKGEIVTEWEAPNIRDSAYVRNHKYSDVLKKAWDYGNNGGLFPETLVGDLVSRARIPTMQRESTQHKILSTVGNLMTGSLHHLERLSREAAFMTSFELSYDKALKKGMQGDAAYNFALNEATSITKDTMFDYSKYNKPTIFQTPTGKFAFQFMTYPLQTTSYLVRNFYGMLPYLNKEGKREAAVKFFGTLGMTWMFAGVVGLPFADLMFGLAEGLRNVLTSDEDEEEDEDSPFNKKVGLKAWFVNRFLPQYFGNETALAIARGPIPAITNMDIGASVSMGSLWYSDRTSTDMDRSAFAKMVVAMTGATGSMVEQLLSAPDDFMSGHPIRGIEKLTPAFARGAAKAWRLATEGEMSYQGKTIAPPEYFTTGMLLGTALGFNPTELSSEKEALFKAKQAMTQLGKERTDITNRLNVAIARAEVNPTEANMQKVEDILETDVTEYNRKNGMLWPLDGEAIQSSMDAATEQRRKSYKGIYHTNEQVRNIVFDWISNLPELQ